MPWDVFKQDDEFCVFRVNEDGERMGDDLGCHESEEEAQAQVRALYANEQKSLKMTWTRAYINKLPDGAFLWVEDGEKDDEGKTVPRSKRHFPYKDASGKIDLNHLRNALARIPQSNIPASEKERLIKKARRILEKQREKSMAEDLRAVKALGGNRVGHYAVLWGDEEHKDLTPGGGEYFTPQTEGLKAIFDALGVLPLLYEHATDGQLKSDVIGRVDVMVPDEWGLWYEAQLEQSREYRAYIDKMIREKRLGTSTGALPGSREVKGGQITRWTIGEVSLTTRPMEWRMMERPVEYLRAAYKALDLTLPEAPGPKGDEESRKRELELIRVKLALLEL